MAERFHSTLTASSGQRLAWCGCGIELNHGNCDAATWDLESQIGENGSTHTDTNFAYYSNRGDVVAFACPTGWHNGDWQTLYSAAGARNAFADVTNSCGWYIAGTSTLYADDGLDRPDYGYMVYRAGLDFCHDARGSSRHDCK